MPDPAVPSPPPDAPAALGALWRGAALPAEALEHIELPSRGPVLPSSFRVALAVQVSMAAAALAAAEVWHQRCGRRQRVSVDGEHAALESLGWFTLDGQTPKVWDKLSGLYPCADGHVRIHANFAHHRDGALRLLGLPPGDATERDAVTAALRDWRVVDFETAAAEAGLVVTAARSFEAWDAHPQAAALRPQPLVAISRIGDAPPRPLPQQAAGAMPLQGLRVLDLTRILAGPVAGRTLAAYGADVMLVNSPNLPNIESIADTSRGKLSAHMNLRSDAGRDALRTLVRDAHVFLQGYRPGGLAALGFAPEDLAALRPGIVCVSLSAYGPTGPWAQRRGFDSLVQTASGFNIAEAAAFGVAEPKAMPLQVLDYSAAYLLAFGALAALQRQVREGGSWLVQVSLAGVGHWLRSLGRQEAVAKLPEPSLEPYIAEEDSGWGRLRAPRHAAQFSRTPVLSPNPARPSMPPGSHPAAWPQ